jgi:ectoine hydroxylase-related dioxygenase (phytanoyl-CoA dioxygenase family)
MGMSDASELRASPHDSGSFHERFLRDGALIVERAFDERCMELIEAAYTENLENPGPLAQRLYPEAGSTFIQSVDDSSRKPAFQAMFRDTPILEIAKSVFGSGGVWYFEDQLFFKKGDTTPVRRTPWHQDTPYHPIAGEKIAVFWIPMQDIPAEAALEVVRGSHHGTLFNGSFFDPSDDTLPVYDEREMPRLPNIEAKREDWDIITCGMNRGDVLIFHTSTLHGGGAVPAGWQRRSLSLRMIGDDVVKVRRPTVNADSPTANNVGDDDTQLQARLNRVPMGAPIHTCGLNRLC